MPDQPAHGDNAGRGGPPASPPASLSPAPAAANPSATGCAGIWITTPTTTSTSTPHQPTSGATGRRADRSGTNARPPYHRPGTKPQLDGFFLGSDSQDCACSWQRFFPEVGATLVEGVGMTPEEARLVPWLAELAVDAMTSDDWSWPRLLTATHPRSVGSYGNRAIAAIEETSGRPLWPWQRLAPAPCARARRGRRPAVAFGRVERPAASRGKSTVVGELASWRQQSGDLFGGQQNILLVARDVGASITVQKPHRLRADGDKSRFKTSAAGGRLSIECLADGSEWLIRSSEGVYSYSAVMAIADEAWETPLPPSVVDDGLHPVILQQTNARLWVVSTANPKATALMLGRRGRRRRRARPARQHAVDRVVGATPIWAWLPRSSCVAA